MLGDYRVATQFTVRGDYECTAQHTLVHEKITVVLEGQPSSKPVEAL